MVTRLFQSCLAAICIAAIAAAESPSSSDSESLPAPAITAEAQIRFINDVELAFGIAGRVEQVRVKEGDIISSAQLLASLDGRIARHEAQTAHLESEIAKTRHDNDADLRFAKATLRVHTSELNRLHAANNRFTISVSDSEIQRLEHLVEQARLTIEQASRDHQIAGFTAEQKQSDAAATQVRLQQHELSAPFSGVIARVDARPGAWLDSNQPAVRLVQLNRVRAEAFVDGGKYGLELVGRSASFRVVGSANEVTSKHAFPGKIVFVAPEIHPVTGQARIWCELDNDDLHLRPGMSGELIIAK